MKKGYANLKTKENWIAFLVCIGVSGMCLFLAFHSLLQGEKQAWFIVSLAIGVLMAICALYVVTSNLRIKRINREYQQELSMELRSKPHVCPKCGTMVASGIYYCASCGKKLR